MLRVALYTHYEDGVGITLDWDKKLFILFVMDEENICLKNTSLSLLAQIFKKAVWQLS